jgi:hypothetical protein
VSDPHIRFVAQLFQLCKILPDLSEFMRSAIALMILNCPLSHYYRAMEILVHAEQQILHLKTFKFGNFEETRLIPYVLKRIRNDEHQEYYY